MFDRSKNAVSIAAITMAVLSLSTPILTEAHTGGEGINKVFSEGDISLNLRYRYEHVDEDGKPKNTHASTLRSRLTLKSGTVGRFRGLIEVDNLSYLGSRRFNNTENGKAAYPVVVDPDYTEVNQAFISYAFDDKNKATLSRQRINHNGQRFLGGVAWRQNEQTFDAARLQLSPTDKLRIDYSYIWRVNRIFGPNGDDNNFTGDTHAAIAAYQFDDNHSLAGFAYLLDFGEAQALSSSTYGIDYKGGLKVCEELSLAIKLSYAQQSDYKSSPLNYDADYYLGELTAKLKPVTIAVGYEVLGSDNGISFKTPLATLHKFQGFADKFLVTPPSGIEDSYLKITTRIGGVKLIAFYHDFQAESGHMDYGSEIDVIAAYNFGKNYTVLFKYAAYNADDFATDTNKAWLMLSTTF